MIVATCYLIVIAFSLGATAFATFTLDRSGKALLQRTLVDEPAVSAGSRLLVLTFLLTNLGWIVFELLPRLPLNQPEQILQFVTDKCGGVLLMLGLSGFVALFALTRIRQLLPPSSAESTL